MNYDDPHPIRAVLRALLRRAAFRLRLIYGAVVTQINHMIANPKTSSAGVVMLFGAWGARSLPERMPLLLGGLGLLFAKDAGPKE